jgi:hypothetical protein
VSGLGGISPSERDTSRRRDRHASVILAAAAAVTMFILFPLGLAIGLIAMAYSHVAGARAAFWAALVIVVLGCLTVVFGWTDFDSGVFQD